MIQTHTPNNIHQKERSIYLHELDEQQAEGILPLVGFKPSKEFTDKTVEEMQTAARKQDRLQEILYQIRLKQQEANASDTDLMQRSTERS